MRNPETTEVERETVLQGLERGRREALLHVVWLLDPRSHLRLANLAELNVLQMEVDRLLNRVAGKQ